jgi:penicillin-binding protein 1A
VMGGDGAMNDMLNAAMVTGTGRRASLLLHPAAGKTGTTQDHRDAWFVGYTAHLVCGVWVGNDQGQAMNNVRGGSLPAAIWRDIMAPAHQGRAVVALPGTAPVLPTVVTAPLAQRVAQPPAPASSAAANQPALPWSTEQSAATPASTEQELAQRPRGILRFMPDGLMLLGRKAP